MPSPSGTKPSRAIHSGGITSENAAAAQLASASPKMPTNLPATIAGRDSRRSAKNAIVRKMSSMLVEA